ncbi:uncharacterized protein JCM6883_003376 [Sporobolomyces salmoneus]|uniref:uncharacterized protein n=1 Tax=Sporobolomyces salmoneus TaxID=183962 RepID=UPI003170DBA2
MDHFPLTELPYEILLRIVHAVDERDPSPTFPRGPSDSLLSLSAVNRWFSKICRPLIFRSVHYVPMATTSPHPAEYRKSRNLESFVKLIKECEAQGMDPIKVQQLSIESVENSFDFDLWYRTSQLDGEEEEEQEQNVIFELIETLVERGLQVLFLKGVLIGGQKAVKFMRAVSNAPRLSAIRFNQVEYGFRDELPLLPKIHTLQIMHGSPQLLDLVAKCPNLDSLLLWPSSRRLGPYTPIIESLLPRLRNLSMDSVRDPSTFVQLADEITRLASERYAEPLPLEELFLEGPMTETDRSILVKSLEHLGNLRRLALYQARNPTPTLFNEIYESRPNLKSLTVMAGDCDGSVEWPCPLEEYLPSLSQFKFVEFFASDRRSPEPEEPLRNLVSAFGARQSAIEFKAFGKLAKACTSLKEAVAIDQDVSEGTSGYFATFKREKGKIRISQKAKTACDFLVGYDRWIRVEED